MNPIDYIIPYFNPNHYRDVNFVTVKEALDKQNNVEINLFLEFQNTEVEKTFNKGWLLNQAVRRGKSPDIVIADVDVVPEPDYFSAFLGWAKSHNYRWAFMWNKLIYEGRFENSKPERVDWPEPGINEGGLVWFTRELWDEMGGANEWIRELRGPDNDLAMRARYLTGTHCAYDMTLRHRWHPHSKMKHTKYLKMNRDILKYTRRHPERVIKMIKKFPNGSPNGPASATCSFYEARTR